MTDMKVFAVLLGSFGLIYYALGIPSSGTYMIIGVAAMVSSLIAK